MQAIIHALKAGLPIVFIGLMLFEFIYLLIKFKTTYPKETLVNCITGGISFVIQFLLKAFIIKDLYPIVYEHKLFSITNPWLMAICAFALYTFIQYATHFLYHKVRLFWCLHEVHHSAVHMNITTGLRTSIFDIIALEQCYLLMPLLGIHPSWYILLYLINRIWGTFIHINEKVISRLRGLDNLLVSPSAHHIHHASNPQYIDKNFGELVTVYDKLFGTYATYNEAPVYGTKKVREQLGFWESQTHEIRSLYQDLKEAKGIKKKCLVLFGPP